MKEKNLLLRTITCVVGVPLVLSMIFLVPQYNYIVFSLFVIVMGFIGSLEMSKILFSKTVPLAYIAPIIPIVQYLQGVFGLYAQLPDLAFVLILLGAFALEIKTGEPDDFKSSIDRASRHGLLVIYPSYLISFVLKFLAISGITSQAIIMYLLLVFGNDMSAYIFGRLFGKNNKGVFKVSPKKSVAGYVGSLFTAVGISFACCAIFKSSLPAFTALQKIILGVGISLTANIGDLLESVFKRSAGVKDSGNIIPGRGGALDCLDSPLASAPIFFIIFNMVMEAM
ncbi:MAG: phosphatidate cytidylyltransferase [Sphaerochaetaceae bacterium]|nr:phosphatidate cytidylyltransferase [Sphaerochaetaceae bacterium]